MGIRGGGGDLNLLPQWTEILEQVESAKVWPVYRDGSYWRVSEGVLNERLRGFLPMWINDPGVQKALEKVAYKWWDRERAADAAARSARPSSGFAPPAQRAQEPPRAVAPAREVTSSDSEPDNWTEILARFTKDQNQR